MNEYLNRELRNRFRFASSYVLFKYPMASDFQLLDIKSLFVNVFFIIIFSTNYFTIM